MDEDKPKPIKYVFEVEFVSEQDWITWSDLLFAILDSKKYRTMLQGMYLAVKPISKTDDDGK